MLFATKQQFCEAYESELARYPWAADPDKRFRFMVGVITTLDGGDTWSPTGEAVAAAWRAIGGKGKPTLKALRSLL